MVKTKYDYVKLKLEFFHSEYDTVLGRMKANNLWGEKSALYNKISKWWPEKSERMADLERKALERAKRNAVWKLELSRDIYLWMKMRSFMLLSKRLNDFEGKKDKDWKIIENEKIDVWEVNTIIKLVKTELGEPTQVTRNYNVEPIDDKLTDEEKDLVERIIIEQNKKNKK